MCSGGCGKRSNRQRMACGLKRQMQTSGQRCPAGTLRHPGFFLASTVVRSGGEDEGHWHRARLQPHRNGADCESLRLLFEHDRGGHAGLTVDRRSRSGPHHGAAAIIRNIDAEPGFLARTVERARLPQETVSFIVLPLVIDGRIAGVLAAHRLRLRERALTDDVQLMRVVASWIGQILKINRLVEKKSRRWKWKTGRSSRRSRATSRRSASRRLWPSAAATSRARRNGSD